MNLVLGAVYGYDFDRLEPFLVSLGDSGFDGRAVLFCAEVDLQSQRRIREFGVEVQPFRHASVPKIQRKLRGHFWKQLGRLGQAPARWAGFRLLQMQLFRFFLYQGYLERVGVDFDRVLLTDVKDVVFQADPFATRTEPGIDVFQESESILLRDEPTNRKWLEQLFGDGATAEIGHFPVLCSGTIMGDPESLVEYVHQFLAALRGARRVFGLGIDQGVHNYLIRKQLVSARVICNGVGQVLTLASASSGIDFCIDEEEWITDAAGHVVPVVHQYDRHPELVDLVNRRFRLATD